jgi:hypothetical protein
MLQDIAILVGEPDKIDQDTFMDAAMVLGEEYAKQLAEFWANQPDFNAVWWYGLLAMIFGTLPFCMWLIFNNMYDVLPLELSIYSHLFTWTPVFVTFIINQFYFDDAFFRGLFRYSVMISIAGVFVGQWMGLAFNLIGMSKLKAWGRWFSWVLFLVNLVYTVLMMTYQLFMTPRIFTWIDNAPYGDEGAYNSQLENDVNEIVEVITEVQETAKTDDTKVIDKKKTTEDDKTAVKIDEKKSDTADKASKTDSNAESKVSEENFMALPTYAF